MFLHLKESVNKRQSERDHICKIKELMVREIGADSMFGCFLWFSLPQN